MLTSNKKEKRDCNIPDTTLMHGLLCILIFIAIWIISNTIEKSCKNVYDIYCSSSINSIMTLKGIIMFHAQISLHLQKLHFSCSNKNPHLYFCCKICLVDNTNHLLVLLLLQLLSKVRTLDAYTKIFSVTQCKLINQVASFNYLFAIRTIIF